MIVDRWKIWFSVALGVLIATFDNSAINVSLPTIAESFAMSLAQTQWVELAYMIGVAMGLLPFGHLSDIWGQRGVCTAGFLTFALGLLIVATATTMPQLWVGRFVQALGGAAFMANGPALIARYFEDDRGKAFAGITMVVSVGSVVGPLGGGWLSQHWGWPWIGWVNIPLCLAAAWGAWLNIPQTPVREKIEVSEHDRSFDAYGSLLMGLWLMVIIIKLTVGLALPWWHGFNALCLTAAVALVGLFVIHHRQARAGHRPILIDVTMFKHPPLANAVVAAFISFIGVKTIFFLMPFYLETVRHAVPLISGCLLMGVSLALSVGAPISGWVSDRFGSQRGGRLISAVGMTCSAMGLFQLAQFTAQTPISWVWLGALMVGFGNGLFHPANSSRMAMAVPPSQLGIMGGVQAVVRTLGMLLAIVLIGALFTQTQSQLTDGASFIKGYRMCFYMAGGATLINALWISFGEGWMASFGSKSKGA